MDETAAASSSHQQVIADDFFSDLFDSQSVVVKEEEEKKESSSNNILTELKDIFYSWSNSILNLETNLNRDSSVTENIAHALTRHVQDGLIDCRDADELKYISYVWKQLLDNLFIHHHLGGNRCSAGIKEIISWLLKLYAIKQINDHIFIETCLELYH